MIQVLTNICKGALMGAANVIPGVSGGTVALLTGIFEKLIHSIKSVDAQALRYLMQLRFRALFQHIDLPFLAAIGGGILVSILSFARLLEYLFEHHALFVWAFFFGLILASVYYVGRRIQRRTLPVIAFFVLGTAVAILIALIEPAGENDSFFYLMLCGAVAMCSMILPGLSGSFVLLLMGNYELVMIDAVNNLDLGILIPVGIGAAAGLALFARLLSWIFSRYHDQTVSLLTGFIFGSLTILWPWKTEITESFGEKVKVIGYTYHRPEMSMETLWAVLIALVGMGVIVLMEQMAADHNKPK